MSGLLSSVMARAYPVQRLAMLSDCVAVLLGNGLAYWYSFGLTPVSDSILLVTVVMMLSVVLINFGTESYSQWRTTTILRLLLNQVRSWALVALVVTSLIFFAEASDRYPRLWLSLSLLLSFVFGAIARISASVLLARIRSSGRNSRPVYLLGTPATLLKVARRMRQTPAEGYSLCGASRLQADMADAEVAKVFDKIRASGCYEVWICLPLSLEGVLKAFIYALRNETFGVRYIPDITNLSLFKHPVSPVAGLYSIDLSPAPMNGPAQLLKRTEDLLLGSLIMVLIAPVCALIALVIKLTSPGPILFKQYRTGINGREFKVYKFRTMKVHQEREGQVTQATRDDSRITPVGAFLRRTSLDELPQFYNVLQGRMSIVGPRPHALAHNEYYRDLVESYMRRHRVRPGITGWAQVNGYRGETDTLEKMQKRVEYDLWYIDNWSLWLDLKIIVMTVFKGFINKNAY